jgi:hypothetical protein
MKTNIITLALALFVGCAHAAKDPGSADALVKQMAGKSPKQMCSDGTSTLTLRSYKGKYCNTTDVCNLMSEICFPEGKDTYGAASSACAKKCESIFGYPFSAFLLQKKK